MPRLHEAPIEELRFEIWTLGIKLRALKRRLSPEERASHERVRFYSDMLDKRRDLLMQRYLDLGLRVTRNGPHPRRPKEIQLPVS